MSTYISEDCEFCLAPAGQCCSEDCVGYQPPEDDAWEVTEGDLGAYPPVTRPLDESLSILAEAVHMLPFGNLVGVRGMGAPDRQDYTDEEYIGRLALWMAEYQPILRREVDDLSEQARKNLSLQLERDVLDTMIRRALERTDI